MEKVNVTCRMSEADVEFLDKLGAWMERDRTYMVNYAVARLRDEHEWQIQQVEKARQEVAEGKVLTDKKFLADLKSWL